MAFLNKSSFVINILGIGMDWKQMTPGTVWGVDVSAGFKKTQMPAYFCSGYIQIKTVP
jgi:hypothetical protein